MNKKIKEIVKPHLIQGILDDIAVNQVTEIIDHADQDTLVIYKLQNDQPSLDRFLVRRKANQKPYVMLFTESPVDTGKLGSKIIQVKKDSFAEVVKKLALAFYPEHQNIKLIGITGTNGKSTVVHLCRSICFAHGRNAASIGTLGIYVNDQKIADTANTTPGSIEIAKTLAGLRKHYAVDFAFIEVSSHSLAQNRLGHLCLTLAGWTSFGRDHLDFHKSIEEYFRAKTLIIDRLCSSQEKIVYVPENEHQLIAMLKESGLPHKLAITKEYPKSDFFKITYNQSNFALAKTLIQKLGIDYVNISCEHLAGPKGRFEIIPSKRGMFIVDYAHSPDGIESVLTSIKMMHPEKKVLIVFGCGGDRDTGKRSLMGNLAYKLSDVVIVTSDNPRSEDPDKIIEMIVAEINDTKKVSTIADRESAIIDAVDRLYSGLVDIVLVAGKGHEEYQEIMGSKIFFSDQEILKRQIGLHESKV